ncbi:hypothetical protein GCM10022226_48590 [Sphaerisporangium flaviroseum]|uniref:Uncharacterized protein n=1 Tax=Sphaerisporangium flaviroseum TaxID=509199 RepID=A0ABP7IN41_9ACTN
MVLGHRDDETRYGDTRAPVSKCPHSHHPVRVDGNEGPSRGGVAGRLRLKVEGLRDRGPVGEHPLGPPGTHLMGAPVAAHPGEEPDTVREEPLRGQGETVNSAHTGRWSRSEVKARRRRRLSEAEG